MVWQNGTTTITGGFRPVISSEIGGASLSGITAPPNYLSSLNTTSSALGANASWTGSSELVASYDSVVLAAKTDASGTAYMEFSPDGTNWDSSLSFSVASGSNEVHRLSVTRPYYRAKFTNGTTAQSYLRLSSMVGSQSPLTSALNSTVQPDSDALVTRSVLMGSVENGTLINVPVTAEGHIEVAVHGPRNPFGSIHVENLTPIFQADGVYGINDQLIRVTTGLGGTAGESDSQFVLQTNTSVGGNSTLQSRKRLRYRPGQGCVGRFTAKFTSGVANSAQVAGLGHSEDGLYFGYSGQNFGVLHAYAGVREVQTLSLSAAAGTAGNVTVVLNNVPFTVPVSNSANGFRTAYEISTGTYAGWTAESIGSGVVFLAGSAGDKTSPFLFSGGATSSAGTFTETRSGVTQTENWTPQTQWNGDKLDGQGYSSVLLDTSKGNVYQIGYQYLGYGALSFQMEGAADGNNPDWITLHTIRYPNTNTAPSFRNPSFPFTASAYSLGSTTNLTLNTASFAGFIEGQKVLNGPQFTYSETSTTVTSAAFKALFTVKNRLTFKHKSNQCVVNVLSINGAIKSNQPVTIYIFKNASLAGSPNFQSYSANSCTAYDNSATTVTIADNDQELFSFSLADTGQSSIDLFNLGIEIQPGDSITLAARASAGATVNFVSASINTREDQ